MKMRGDWRSYSYRVPSEAIVAVFRDGLVGQDDGDGEDMEERL